MQSFIDEATLSLALKQLAGTAGTQFRIWMVLKHVGLTHESPVTITTRSTDDSLVRLFGCGHPDGKLFTPYVSIPSDRFMASDAGRSIIQTTVKQWADGTGVYLPTEYLNVEQLPQQGNIKPYKVSTRRSYPEGLGIGKNGFSHTEGGRVSVPKQALAIWYGRQTAIPEDQEPVDYLLKNLRTDLGLSPVEEECVFVDKYIPTSMRSAALSDSEIFALIGRLATSEYTSVELPASRAEHIDNIRSKQTMSTQPRFLTTAPEVTLKSVIDSGAKAILLSGPPRTGKTRAIDLIIPRGDPSRVSIQIHDGWTYEHLIQGLRPQADNSFAYVLGPLADAIKTGKKKHCFGGD